MADEAENPEIVELRKLLQQTVELVNQNAKDNAYLRGAFEQMDKRLDDLTVNMNQRFEQGDKRFEQGDGRETLDSPESEALHQMGQRIEEHWVATTKSSEVNQPPSDLDQQFTDETYQSKLLKRIINGMTILMWLAAIALIIKIFVEL
ncbi:hypothetical protein HYR99_34190 [Candidatus Poribacteria bacterium]|nr:hypothetical protein [Candidatus Poribacteria bacterium]